MPLKRFYSRLFVVGMVFLFNPVVSLVDVMPDFIGALLIATSMTEIAMLDERLEQARRLIYYVAGISAVRTVLMFFMFDMDETAVLSAVSLLGVGELFALIYFCISFFGGISYIAQRSDSENVLGEIDRIKRLWILFFIVHTASAIVPELFALPQQVSREYPDDIPWATERQLLMYRYYARVLFGTISLFLGIWWLKVSFPFFKGVREDKPFRASIEKRYGEFLAENPLQLLFLDVKFAFILFIIGCALQFNLTVDGIAVLPAWAGTLCILVAAFRLNKDAKRSFLLLFALAALQALAVYLLGGIPTGIILALTSILAVYLGERSIVARVKAAIDWETDAYFYITRLFYFAFFVLGVIYLVWVNYWVHLARILCFGAWLAILLWIANSVIGEIKLRRRL